MKEQTRSVGYLPMQIDHLRKSEEEEEDKEEGRVETRKVTELVSS